ncbi:hypothetical protein M8C21_018888 [Ambrosia artemisiifolia]|uniref:40S ribosomal protein S4 n=1 Tax=Ambrosia artemisiifolia TaxID=4212 RepID=A0AAD5GEB3_AMBAR|nr:hypothetical protein M8C21_018888 [Ambrosia artemisiifolia]
MLSGLKFISRDQIDKANDERSSDSDTRKSNKKKKKSRHHEDGYEKIKKRSKKKWYSSEEDSSDGSESDSDDTRTRRKRKGKSKKSRSSREYSSDDDDEDKKGHKKKGKKRLDKNFESDEDGVSRSPNADNIVRKEMGLEWMLRPKEDVTSKSASASSDLLEETPTKEARGLKKHMKRLNAPKHWMLDKLGGAFAPKPSSGPHKSRECLPLILILRNRLKYALTYREVQSILMQRHVLVDNKVRTDKTYPAGFMDVVSIPKTNESFRLLYDTKGRFRLHSIRDEESKFKLCKVRSVQFGSKGIPYINTYDGRTIRYPDPLIKANDTIKLDLESNKIVDFIKFDVGNVVMVTGGRNTGRVGILKNREKHKGSFETVHIQDATGHEFATRLANVFTLGKGSKPWVSLPKGKGIKLTIIEEARKRQAAAAAVA